MPRNLKKNRFIYMHPVQINFSTTTGTLAVTQFNIAPPSMSPGCLVTDWGVVLDTALISGTVHQIQLQKAGTTTAVSAALDLCTATVPLVVDTEKTAEGNGVTINAGDRIEIECIATTGTITTTAKGTLFIGFSL